MSTAGISVLSHMKRVKQKDSNYPPHPPPPHMLIAPNIAFIALGHVTLTAAARGGVALMVVT